MSTPLGARMARGVFWSLTGSLVSRGLGLLAAILVGRMLGKESFGELSIIQNTIGMFGTLAGLGMGLTANKHIAEFKQTSPMRAGTILGAASALAWVSSAVMALVLFSFAPWLARETLSAPHLVDLLRAGSLLLLMSGVNGAQMGVLSGFEAFKAIARINLISGLLSFPLIVAGAWVWGVEGAVGGLIVTQFINCMLCFSAIRYETKRFGIHLSFSGWRTELPLFWSFSLPAVLTGILNSIVTWGAGALVVNNVGGYSQMGLYNAAFRVKFLPEAFLGMLIAPMLPILSESFGRGDRVTFERTLGFNFLLAIAIIIPVSLLQLAAPWLTLLPYGGDYQGGDVIVQFLMLHSISYALLFPMGSVFISMGKMWFSWICNFMYAVMLGLTTWFLVPQYGVAGYAAAIAFSFAVCNIPCVIFLYQKVPRVMRFIHWGFVTSLIGLLAFVCIISYWFFSNLSALVVGCGITIVFVLCVIVYLIRRKNVEND